MGRLRIICSLVFALLSNSFLLGTPLIIEEGNWGDVETNEIHKVLSSTLSLFQPSCPTLQKHTIVVSSTADDPKVLYELRDGHTYHIQLTAKNRHWCQYVFQFAHELGHIMCNFRKENHANLWFEESICELASLYALQRMGNKWDQISDGTNSKEYAQEFEKYRIHRIKESSYPVNFQLAAWWNQNRSILSQNPHLRKQNIWVALTLSDLFDQNPTIAWSTCFYLNNSLTHRKADFEQYLQNWKNACPETTQKEFVEKIISRFQFQ
jgi:hypothetical protein